MPKNNRWEHLNDFKKTEEGKYEYQGKSCVFAGSDEEKRKAYLFLWITLTALTLSSVLSGCISGAGITNTFYVIIPYLLEICALFALAWNHIKLLVRRGEIKSYIYKSAHPKIPPSAALVAFFAIAGCLLSLVFSITTGFKDGVFKAVLYLVLKLASAGIAVIYRNKFLKLEWIEL